jgi:PAS domain S-box-containing protein
MTIQANTSQRQATEQQAGFNQSSDSANGCAVFMLDCDGRVQSWSETAEQLHGYSPSEIVGRRIDICYPSEARTASLPLQLLRRSSSLGHVEDEGWRLRKDGSTFWAKVATTALTDAQGKLLGHAVVTRDLTFQRRTTELQQQQEEILRGEERFRLLVEGVQEYAIFMLDAKGTVATWNSGAERIKGYKAEEIIGRHFSIFRTAEEIASGACERELAMAARDGKLEEEGWRVRKDGSRFWANVLLTAIHDRSGRLLGFGKVTRDLTEHQLLDEERLRRARAEEAVRLRDEFLLIASHELRTPLTSLRLDLYGIHQDLLRDPSKLAKKLERAARNSDRLAALIESLLSVTRLAHGKLVLKPIPLDLVHVVDQSIDGLRSQATKAGCEIVLSSAGPVRGIWDRLRMEQVCMNLLSNALKYGAGHPVEVRVVADEDTATVEISDRGTGIPEPDLERIFDRFERASSLRHYGGLGLGLYVSREIVRGHAGSIHAANRPGGGATFTVRLPMQRAPVAPKSAGES